ncbi:hypothetical protein [Pradoshia sp.]
MKNDDIFISHLRKLYRNGLITDKTFKHVYSAHEKFQTAAHEVHTNRPVAQQPFVKPAESPAPVKPPKQKALKSKEDLRERNITWSLIAGVIMLLFGGLMFATNNWSSYSPMVKTLWVVLICLFFYGIHLVTDKVFKISKSSFSFLVLSNLFFPVIWISAGYFQLFGSWFSIEGGGRYIYGFAFSFFTTAVYMYFMRKHSSLLFTSLVYGGITITAGFLVKSIVHSQDLFFLCMTLTNFLLLWGRKQITYWVNHALFTQHFNLYLQANLILVSLFTVFIYESKTVNGISILLSGVLYLLVSQYQNRKEYYYIFPILLIYGVYQTFDHLSHEATILLLGALGSVFAGLIYYARERTSSEWETMYRYTGTGVTIIAFSYVSLDAFFAQNGNQFVTALAYFLMFATIIALTKKTHIIPVAAFGIVYFFLGCFSLGLALSDWIRLDITWSVLLVSNLIMYGAVLFSPFAYIRKYNMLYYCAAHITFLLLIGYAAIDGISFGIWLVTMIQSVLLYAHKQSPFAKAVPFLLAGGWYSFFNEFAALDEQWIPFCLSIILWLTALTAYKRLPHIRLLFDYLSGGFYALGAILCFPPAIIEPGGLWQVVFFAFGMLFFSHMTKTYPIRYLWIGAGVAFLLTYFAAISLLDTGNLTSFLYLAGPVLLAAGEHNLRRRIPAHPFFLYLALSSFLIVCLIIETVGLDTYWEYTLGIGLYYYAYRLVQREWMKKMMLYLSMSFIPLTLLKWGLYAEWTLSALSFIPLITALIYFAFWVLAKPETKKRLMYFIVLFMSFSLPSFFFVDEGYSIIFVLIYSGLLMFFIHQIRLYILLLWPILSFILTWKSYVGMHLEGSIYLELAGALLAILTLTTIGLITFKHPFQLSGKWVKDEPIVDWYWIGSFMYVLTHPVPVDAGIFLRMLPGFVITGLLFVQISRLENLHWRNIMRTSTILSLLNPYYLLLNYLTLPSYVEVEAYLIPVIFILLYLEKKIWRENNMLRLIHKIGLVLAAVFIVYDAILENSLEEAITVGSLSLAAAIYGFYAKQLMYFTTGICIILLNVFLQTRPFWGNLPWWWYLFIGGGVLITVATLNEWKSKKNEQNGRKGNLYQEVIKKIKLYFSGWN